MNEDLKKLETLDYKPKITEVPIKCECGWNGKVIECDCDADYPEKTDNGSLRCPKCGRIVTMKLLKQSASASRETLGFNSAVIKPETRAEKQEDAGQQLKQPTCSDCKFEIIDGSRCESSKKPCMSFTPKTDQPKCKTCGDADCIIKGSAFHVKRTEQPNQELIERD